MKPFIPLVLLLGITAEPQSACAGQYEMSYGGRLVDATTGAPLSGPIAGQVKFFASQSDTSELKTVSLVEIPLVDGIFSVKIALTPQEWETLFRDRSTVWLEFRDSTHGKTYARQELSALPFAIRAASIPVDGTTVGFNGDGKLAVKNAGVVLNLGGDVSGTSSAATVNGLLGKPLPSNPATNGFLKWNGTGWATEAVSGSAGGTVTGVYAESPLKVAVGTNTTNPSLSLETVPESKIDALIVRRSELSGYSLAGHNHDASYAPLAHNHNGTYSLLGHDHDTRYSLIGHDHDTRYAALVHNHDGTYAPLTHEHTNIDLSKLNTTQALSLTNALSSNTSVTTPVLKSFDTGGLKFQGSTGAEIGSIGNTGTWTLGTGLTTIPGALKVSSLGAGYLKSDALGAISSEALPDASASTAGLVSTGAQTFAGTKSFKNGLKLLDDEPTPHAITLAAPATAADYSLTLPAAQGAAGTFLQNNGSGALSWASPAAPTNIANAQISATAAIDLSKLNLTQALVTANSITAGGALVTKGIAGNAAASQGGLNFAAGNTRFLSYGADTTTAGGFKFLSLSSNESVNVEAASVTPAGEWTWGPSRPVNFQGVVHKVRGHIAVGTPGTPAVDESGFMTLSTNLKLNTYGNRYESTLGGTGIVMDTRAGNGSPAMLFYTNLPGDGLITEATWKGVLFPNGGWAFGNPSSPADHTAYGNFNATGCLKAGGVTANGTCASDERLKKDILPLSGSLARILSLRPVEYSWRREEYPSLNLGTQREWGLIAQETARVFPEFVSQGDDGFYRVRYGLGLQMHVLRAVQELAEENRALKDKVTSLEGEVKALKDIVCSALPGARGCP